VNEKLAEALQDDPRVLERLQLHFESGLRKSQCTGGLSLEGLLDVCKRLAASSEERVDRKWAQDALERQWKGDPIAEEDAEINYYDFLNVMLGRKRYKVSLWLYDISDGVAKRWSWLLLGRHFDGIWHSGLVVDFPDRQSEFWFGGSLFDTVAGESPFGTPVQKRELGYTYKTRSEIRNYMGRHLRRAFNRQQYDVLLHNCNHFSDELALFTHNKHIPDDVVNLAEHVLSTPLARLSRPLLNRWLGGFGQREDHVVESTELEIQPGALVEFTRVEGGRHMVGEIIAVAADCEIQSLDYWQRSASNWSVPRSLVTKVLRPAPELQRQSTEKVADEALCSLIPLPCLLCSSTHKISAPAQKQLARPRQQKTKYISI